MDDSNYNRRRVLKQLATSGVVITGIGAATGSASAQSVPSNISETNLSADEYLKQRRQEFLNNPSKVEERLKRKSNHPTPDYQDVEEGPLSWENLGVPDGGDGTGGLVTQGIHDRCMHNTSRGCHIHRKECSNNVCNNAWNYAGKALSRYMNYCRSQADVAAEIEAHCGIFDYNVGLTCDGWGIDSVSTEKRPE